MKRKLMSFGLLMLLLIPVSAVAQLRPDNIDSVVQVLSVREKAQLAVGAGWGSMFQGLHIPFSGHHRVPGAAGETRGIRRLGIPSLVLADGPAGVRMRALGATAWPTGQSLAATGDTALVYAVGHAMGEEAAVFGVDVLLGPGMNLATNPLCGRNYEYFSADVDVSSRTATAMVRGIQSEGVGACVKHYAVNRQETDRFHHDEQVDSMTLRTTYLENFRRTVTVAQPWAVMSAYNRVNGTPAQLHHGLLTDVLRYEWGYEGVVLTDWKNHPEAPEKIAAGNDLLMPGGSSQVRRIVRAVRRGSLPEERLDEAARRVLQMVVRSHTYRQDWPLAFDTLAHRALCRQAGAAGCVWLKEMAQPVLTDDARVALLGVHSYYLIAGGTGSGYVNSSRSVSLADALRDEGFSLVNGLANYYTDYLQHRRSYGRISGMGPVGKYMGRPAAKEPMPEIAVIAEAVDEADVVVVTIGRQAGEGRDRQPEDLLLSKLEQQLIEQASGLCREQKKRLVVVLNCAGEMRVEGWSHLADGILMAWCPGQEGGYSILDVLRAPTSIIE